MTAPLALFATALAVGFSGAMSPGPYLTVTIARTIRSGARSALLMLVGHALLEGVLLVGFAFGLQAVLRQDSVIRVMSPVGGAVLLWMGGTILWGALRGTISADLEDSGTEPRFGPVAAGALVSLSNPYWTLWWATIGATLAAQGLEYGPVGVAAFFLGHELADLIWYGAVVFAVSKGRHLLSDRVYRVVMGGLAAFLVYLGVRFVLTGAGIG